MNINRKSLFKIIKSFCVVLTGLAWVLSVSYAYASHIGIPPNVQIDFINGVAPENISCPDAPLTSLTLMFDVSGQGSAPPGRVEQYSITFDPGDGTGPILVPSIFTPDKGKHVDFGFTSSFTYIYPANGNYTAIVALEHSQTGGQDNQIDSVQTIEICIFNPQTPTLQVSAVESFSCPDQPLSGAVTLVGSGVGSAPPGNAEDYKVTIDWNDGTPVEVSASTFTPASGILVNFDYAFGPTGHIYAPGTYTATVSLSYTDPALGDQIVVQDTIDICIFNPQTPTLSVEAVEPFSCVDNPLQGVVTLVGSALGASGVLGVEDFRIEINWDDGTPLEVVDDAQFTPATGSFENFGVTYGRQHTYANGTYTAVVSLKSSDGQTAASDSLEICVFNPQTAAVVANAVEPFSCTEGPLQGVVTLEGSGSGASGILGVGDFTVVIDWNDGSAPEVVDDAMFSATGPFENFGFTFGGRQHTYANGTFNALVSLKSSDGQTAASATVEICVFNPQSADLVANAVEPFSCTEGPLQGAVTLEGSGQGASGILGVGDFTVVIDWNDGSAPEVVDDAQFTPATGPFENFDVTFGNRQHTYANGTYAAVVSLVSSDGQTAASATVDICVFNPQTPTLDANAVESFSCPDEPLSGDVTLEGSGQGASGVLGVEDFTLVIDWKDGSPVEVVDDAVFSPATGPFENFDVTFGGRQHTYANGTYAAVVSLVSSGGQTAASATVDICVFNPQTPALQVTAVESFSCPDEPLSGAVTLEGSGQGASGVLGVEDFTVVIDWKDGSPVEVVDDAVYTPATGPFENFGFTFGGRQHIYAGGTFIAEVSLVSSDGQTAASDTLEICVFNPVELTLQVDSINGQPPESITCDNPITGPVTIVGSGEGAAILAGAGVENFLVKIDWDDGSLPEVINATFNPSSGTLLNFAYDFQADHTYSGDRTYLISITFLDFDPVEQFNFAALTETVEICFIAPKGTVTGAVTDFDSGLPIFGATVEDVTDEPAILGSFPNFNNYVIDALPGLRTIRVSAQGFDPVEHQVFVTVDETSFQDYQLSLLQSDVNIFLLTIPIGDKPQGNAPQVTLLPAWIEATFQGVVVQTSFVRIGFSYVFVDLPIGKITFRAESSFYEVGQRTSTNSFIKRAGINRDKAQIKNIKLSAGVPDARATAITGTIAGVVDNGVGFVAATVFATVDFEGEALVIVGIDSDAVTGVYVIPLVPTGEANVEADDSINSDRSVVVPTTVVGGETVIENLTVFPFDAENSNFVPFVLSGPSIFIAEEDNRLLTIDDFFVTDLDHTFSIDHTFQVHPGINYTLSDVMIDSVLLTSNLDFNGVLLVPVTVSDGINASLPFVLTVNVSAEGDAIVFVDFDTGNPAPGGTGGADNPLLSVGDALSAVLPEGTILISGIATSIEAPLTINQAVTLVNNNALGEPVTIAPVVARDATLSETGFVTRSGSPRR